MNRTDSLDGIGVRLMRPARPRVKTLLELTSAKAVPRYKVMGLDRVPRAPVAMVGRGKLSSGGNGRAGSTRGRRERSDTLVEGISAILDCVVGCV